MAKTKGSKKRGRDIVALACTECKERNYTTYKKIKGGEKLSLKKYCKQCRKHVLHTEKKK